MSYISDYLKTCEGTESPAEYHTWAMLSTLSVFAGRRFWLPFGPFHFYTNLYVVLVGDPGVTKTSALNRAKGIVRAAKICPVAATQMTKEAMSLEMSSTIEGKPKKVPFAGQKFYEYNGQKLEYNQYAIIASELTQFIGVNPIGFLDFLTTVWDEPIYEVKTKNKGDDYVLGPYITLLACMTPQIVKGFLKQNVLNGGFARRAAMVFSANSGIVPWPKFTQEQEEAQNRCIAFGKALQSRSGPFSVSDECKEFYEHWYEENKRTLTDRSPSTRGWYNSKAEMLFKVSMLIALAESDQLVIELPHYKLAMRFCEMVEANLERVYEGSGINPNSGAAAQICRMLEAHDKPMNRKHIEMMFFDQATDLAALRDTIAHLCMVGRLKEKQLNVGGQVLGSVLGTPAAVDRYTDSDLAQFLVKPLGPHVVSGMGLLPSDGQ